MGEPKGVAIYNQKTNTLEVLVNTRGTSIYDRFDHYSAMIVIHELYHAYQDHQKLACTQNRGEAQAYLAGCDFIYHLDPRLISKTRWISGITGETAPYFSVPSSVVVSKDLAKVERRYAWFMEFYSMITDTRVIDMIANAHVKEESLVGKYKAARTAVLNNRKGLIYFKKVKEGIQVQPSNALVDHIVYGMALFMIHIKGRHIEEALGQINDVFDTFYGKVNHFTPPTDRFYKFDGIE